MSDNSTPNSQKQTDHDYDGIKELDNNLPNWWLLTFYVTIAFSVVYMIVYHFGGEGLSAEAAYNQEMAKAASTAPTQNQKYTDEEIMLASKDPNRAVKGKAIYDGKCVACHGVSGGGGIGPNLTDDYWIHGGAPAKIAHVIKVGVPEKGMIAWEALLSEDEILDVVAHIKTLHGTNPKDAKAPQGELEAL